MIKPLVSRSRIFQLPGLGREELARVARMALADAERGLGGYRTEVGEEAMEHLLNVAHGDARSCSTRWSWRSPPPPPMRTGW